MLIDSDTENSIIIEHDKHTKLKCLKDTPLKIDCGSNQKVLEASMVYDNPSESDDDDDEGKRNEKDTPMKTDNGTSQKILEVSTVEDNLSESDDDVDKNESTKADRTAPLQYDGSDDSDEASEEVDDEETDEGPDEDQMVMSRATRMSIMGVVPKDHDSDESDFIESDDVSTYT